MRIRCRAGLGLIGSLGFLALAPAGAASAVGAPAAGAQSYSIDQSHYFASPEIEAAQRQQRLDEGKRVGKAH